MPVADPIKQAVWNQYVAVVLAYRSTAEWPDDPLFRQTAVTMMNLSRYNASRWCEANVGSCFWLRLGAGISVMVSECRMNGSPVSRLLRSKFQASFHSQLLTRKETIGRASQSVP